MTRKPPQLFSSLYLISCSWVVPSFLLRRSPWRIGVSSNSLVVLCAVSLKLDETGFEGNFIGFTAAFHYLASFMTVPAAIHAICKRGARLAKGQLR